MEPSPYSDIVVNASLMLGSAIVASVRHYLACSDNLYSPLLSRNSVVSQFRLEEPMHCGTMAGYCLLSNATREHDDRRVVTLSGTQPSRALSTTFLVYPYPLLPCAPRAHLIPLFSGYFNICLRAGDSGNVAWV